MMRPPLRFSILALLSNSKVNIFNPGLVSFMEKLNDGNWSISDNQASFGAFLIDHINYFKELNFKEDTDEQLIKHFEELIRDRKSHWDFSNLTSDKCLIR